ncbi:MAG: family 16 glycoside hydrolase [Rhodopirellula sp. JB055]|uniref:3-keto-disaccharide hydrolase n=1 Tax=Rhodopirellula sp. JB055 TaxID=3342846 RepID=UPI00370A7A7F
MSFRKFLATPTPRVFAGFLTLCLTVALTPPSVSAQEKDSPAKEKADAPKKDAPPAETNSEKKAGKASENAQKPKASEEKKAPPPKEEKVQSKKPAPEKAAEAQPADPKPDPTWVEKGVWTLPPTDGPAAVDFQLIGEYAGDVSIATEKSTDDSDASKQSTKQRYGIQIRAIGSGEFEALAYVGGLPGDEKFNEATQLRLIGRRNGETLVLSGGPWALFAGPEKCRLINFEGDSLGELPRVIRTSPTMGAQPPKEAIVLFNGKNTDQFSKARIASEGLLAQGANVKWLLNDFDLHLEFRIPHMPGKQGQQRGNSGVYLQSRYECQILDSFGTDRVFNGLGALYRFKPPRLNMAFPPLTWQTYDIRFTAARFGADGKKLRPAHVTSWVNGVKVQDNVALPGPTGAGKPEEALPLPTLLQDHSDPVRYRNVWVLDRGIATSDSFPPKSDN